MRKAVIRLTLGTLLLTLSFRAEAQQAEKVFRIGVLVAPSASFISDQACKHFVNDCTSFGMLNEKTWSLSTDMQKEDSIGCQTLQPN